MSDTPKKQMVRYLSSGIPLTLGQEVDISEHLHVQGRSFDEATANARQLSIIRRGIYIHYCRELCLVLAASVFVLLLLYYQCIGEFMRWPAWLALALFCLVNYLVLLALTTASGSPYAPFNNTTSPLIQNSCKFHRVQGTFDRDR